MFKKKIIIQYTYTVIYEPVQEGGYKVTVPSLSGLITYGRNMKEARTMALDAIKCYLEAALKDKEQISNESSLLHERVSISSEEFSYV